MKRLLSVLMVFCVLLTIVMLGSTLTVSAESGGEVWDGSASKTFASGTGTTEDPFVIENASQLAYFSKAVTVDGITFSGKYVKLGNDICLNDTSDWNEWSDNVPKNVWVPIGSKTKPFKGYFLGNDKTISGIYVDEELYAGLFGYCESASIKNVRVKESFIKSSASGYAGGIVGYAFGGNLGMTSIYNCSNYATVIGNYAGGVCGYVEGDTWLKCDSNIGDIKGLGDDAYSGGIVGFFAGSEDTLLYKSFNGGKIEGKKSGGIAGGFYSGFSTGYYCNSMGYCNSPLEDLDSSIYWCYNYGDITSQECSGGIVGECNLANRYYSSVSTSERCVQYTYNVGIIESEGLSGQIIGDARIYKSATSTDKTVYLNKSYYFNSVPSVQYAIGGLSSDSGYAISLSKDQAQTQDSYTNFDFGSVWTFSGDDEYPFPVLKDNPHINLHEHKYNDTVTAPTCTEQGYTTYTCECGDSYVADYVDAKGHSHTSEVTTPATHTTTGVMTYICSCGDTYTETIAKIEKHEYKSVVTAPTCEDKGYTTYTCECGESYVADYVDAKGHSHTSEVTTPATHTTTGVMTYTCHCGDTYTETIDKIAEHNHTAVVTAPTCEDQGYTTYTCVCGDSYVADYVDAKGHTAGEWVVTKPATSTQSGTKTQSCTECGTVLNTQTIPAYGKVNSVSVSNVSLDYKSSTTLNPQISVDVGVKYTVTYSSSNPSVASVDANGKVSTGKTGSATITVTVTDEYGNTVSDTCNVEVKYNWWQWILVIVLFGWIWY